MVLGRTRAVLRERRPLDRRADPGDAGLRGDRAQAPAERCGVPRGPVSPVVRRAAGRQGAPLPPSVGSGSDGRGTHCGRGGELACRCAGPNATVAVLQSASWTSTGPNATRHGREPRDSSRGPGRADRHEAERKCPHSCHQRVSRLLPFWWQPLVKAVAAVTFLPSQALAQVVRAADSEGEPALYPTFPLHPPESSTIGRAIP